MVYGTRDKAIKQKEDAYKCSQLSHQFDARGIKYSPPSFFMSTVVTGDRDRLN